MRSRCQRVSFRPPPATREDDPQQRELRTRLEKLPNAGLPALLDWAEEYRGTRAEAQEAVEDLLAIGADWVRARVAAKLREPGADATPELRAHAVLTACRKSLVQRNANPQMVAERALLALRASAGA